MEDSDAPTIQVVREVPTYMPVMSVDEAIQRRSILVEMIDKKYLVKGSDYEDASERYKRGGEERLVLLKPGAEKLAVFFGYVAGYSIVDKIEELGIGGVLAYTYKCTLMRGGEPVAEADGSANSREIKYRWRWVSPEEYEQLGRPDKFGGRDSTVVEFKFAVDKAETSGPYAKPAEYWKRFQDAIADGTAVQTTKKIKSGEDRPAVSIPGFAYKVENPDFPDLANTLRKIAQKRAMVSAVLAAVGCSEFFTVDIDADTEPDQPAAAAPPPGSNADFKQALSAQEEADARADPLHQRPQPTRGAEAAAVATEAGAAPLATIEIAQEAFKNLCGRLAITKNTKPSIVDLTLALQAVLKVENLVEAKPEALLEKIQALAARPTIEAIEMIKTAAAGTKPTRIAPEDTKPPAAAAPPEGAMNATQFKTLNIGGMIATLVRNRLPRRAAEIQAYLRRTLGLEKMPYSDPTVEAALCVLYSMDDEALNAELAKGVK